MKKQLFFICPTDCLESHLVKKFGEEISFFTSLGNSILLDKEAVLEINEILESKEIREVTLVIAHDNKLIVDALKGRGLVGIKGLRSFYNELTIKKALSEQIWNANNIQLPIIVSLMNDKRKELLRKLSSSIVHNLEFNTIIYDRRKRLFTMIDSQLYYKQISVLN